MGGKQHSANTLKEDGNKTSQSTEISSIIMKPDFRMRETDKETIAVYKEDLEQIIEKSPIVLFKTTEGLILVDGFHRVAAAKQLNWKSIKAQIINGSIQEAFSYACLANLTHGKPLKPTERRRAIREYIKINASLSNVEIGKNVGKGETTIRRYREELEANGEIQPQDKRLGSDGKTRTVPTSPIGEIPKFNAFDVWFQTRVINDDVFNELASDKLKYDLVIADPPYGITGNQWDKQTKFELLTFTRKWLNLVLQHLKSTGRLFIFWSREYLFELKPLLDEVKSDYPLHFGGLIVWNFRNILTVPNNRKELKITWEPIFYFYGLEAGDLYRPDTELSGKPWDGVDSDVWAYAIPQSNFSDKKIHPAQKPLELYKHIIELSTKTNDLILDPFAGSGTTGHAAYELGREFKLIEENIEYVQLIRSRLREVFQNGKQN